MTTDPTKDADTSKKLSPYSILCNDNPGSIITHVVLRGPNYDEWSQGIKIALLAKFKLGFLDGTVKQPADGSDDLDRWWIINAMVVAWIFNTIEPNLRSTISYRSTAKELWDDISQRFSVGNASRIYQLTTDIIDCKQRTDESIMTYFGRIKKVWDDLNNYQVQPVCSCTGCTCGISKKIQTQRDEERVRQFLMGLDTGYSTVRSTILGTEPLPDINQVYSRLVQEEGVRAITRPPTDSLPDPVAFSARSSGFGRDTKSGGGRSTDGSRLFCTACHRGGHDVTTCFRVTGKYPEWWGDRPRYKIELHNSRPNGQSAGRAHGGARANSASAGHIASTSSHPPLTNADRAALDDLNDDEWSELLAL
ncbi:hypothetical protein vseg_004298 [Gypsophila vaccaria]